jgi:hypothetical protein
MGEASRQLDSTIDVDLVAAQFDVLDNNTHRKALLEATRARDVYRKLVDALTEENEKLKRGLVGPKSERFKGEDSQSSLQVLAEFLGRTDVEGSDAKQLADELLAQAEAEAQTDAGDGGGEDGTDDKPHRRPRKPTGRSTKGEHVARMTIELLPQEVKRLGLDAFERIGQEYPSTTRRASNSACTSMA